jgi:ABC-type transport system involved in multi-copper enzyme maturation permease subunit
MAKAPTPPGLLGAATRVFDLSLGEMLWSRRTIFSLLIVGVPVLIAIGVRIANLFGGHMRVSDVVVNGPTIFGLMIWAFYVRFIVPVLGVFYGTALIADEVEDKTITYLFTRPISRGSVLLGKYLAYLACTTCVVLPSVVLVWLLIVPLGGGYGQSFPDMVQDLAILVLGLLAYGALFALIGTVMKRPLIVGLVFVFGWETTALVLPGYLKRLTVAYYVQGLVPHAMPTDSMVSLLQGIMRETPTVAQSLGWMGVLVVVCLWLGIRFVTTREYVLEQ